MQPDRNCISMSADEKIALLNHDRPRTRVGRPFPRRRLKVLVTQFWRLSGDGGHSSISWLMRWPSLLVRAGGAGDVDGFLFSFYPFFHQGRCMELYLF